MGSLISKMKFQIVIADEAHYLKSRDSQRSKSLIPLLKKFKRVLLLTGTPLLGRPAEIYNLLKILRPDLFTYFQEFGIRYTKPQKTQYGVDWTGSSNTRELHLLLEKSLMIRRLKSEVL
jgi:SWI/SNF-related matrix-associated actin-dependent regulator of chromatin subfamily A-like protein 1